MENGSIGKCNQIAYWGEFIIDCALFWAFLQGSRHFAGGGDGLPQPNTFTIIMPAGMAFSVWHLDSKFGSSYTSTFFLIDAGIGSSPDKTLDPGMLGHCKVCWGLLCL